MTNRRGPRIDPREVLRAEIAALPGRRDTDPQNSTRISTDFLAGGYGIIVEAAKGRRLSLSAYLRRAAYAMACHDLGLPLSDALSRDPRVSRETGVGFSDPDGTRFGRWEIERLVGEVDDAESEPAGA